MGTKCTQTKPNFSFKEHVTSKTIIISLAELSLQVGLPKEIHRICPDEQVGSYHICCHTRYYRNKSGNPIVPQYLKNTNVNIFIMYLL